MSIEPGKSLTKVDKNVVAAAERFSNSLPQLMAGMATALQMMGNVGSLQSSLVKALQNVLGELDEEKKRNLVEAQLVSLLKSDPEKGLRELGNLMRTAFSSKIDQLMFRLANDAMFIHRAHTMKD